MLKWIIFLPILFGCAPQMTAYQSRMLPPETWKIRHSSTGTECINLTGTYSMKGMPAPEAPLKFRGAPYSLDILLGQDIPHDSRGKVTSVKLEQQDSMLIKVGYYIEEHLAFEKTISNRDRTIICEPDRVRIVRKSVETKGEATRGLADIYDTLFVGEDESLIVNKTIEGENTGLF